MAHGESCRGEGMLGDDVPNQNSAHRRNPLSGRGGRGALLRLDRLDAKAVARRTRCTKALSAAQKQPLDRTEHPPLQRTRATRIDDGFRQSCITERRIKRWIFSRKMQKNGIHYCVCQFFFVSLQPILYARVCSARAYAINKLGRKI